MTGNASELFIVHRWNNPQTTSDYPFLALAADCSTLLSIGNYGLGFDWELPDEAQLWLEDDFAPTGEVFDLDLSPIRHLLDATYVGGADFGIVNFDHALRPIGLELSLAEQGEADMGAEYVIHRLGYYQRFYREAARHSPVSPAERALLDTFCDSSLAYLTVECGTKITAPPPPRYRKTSRLNLW